jgi:hypothetical protein
MKEHVKGHKTISSTAILCDTDGCFHIEFPKLGKIFTTISVKIPAGKKSASISSKDVKYILEWYRAWRSGFYDAPRSEDGYSAYLSLERKLRRFIEK